MMKLSNYDFRQQIHLDQEKFEELFVLCSDNKNMINFNLLSY